MAQECGGIIAQIASRTPMETGSVVTDVIHTTNLRRCIDAETKVATRQIVCSVLSMLTILQT